MSLNDTFFTITNSFLKVISEFFVYTTINSLDKTTKADRSLAFILFLTIIILSFIGLIKTIFLFFYFFLIHIIGTYFHLIKVLCTSKCSISFPKAVKKNCILTYSEIKKFYSFNFYSFTQKCKGFTLVFLYLIFIFYNIILTSLSYISQVELEDSIGKNIILILCYWVNVFFEIYLPLFYFTRKEKRFTIFFAFSFIMALIAFGVCGYGVYDSYLQINYYYRIYSIGFAVYLIILKSLAIKKIYSYDKKKKAMKIYLTHPYKNSNLDETIHISPYSKNELTVLTNKFQLNNIYLTQGENLYYHSRDRFYYKKTLLVLFVLTLIIKIAILSFIIIYPGYDDNDQKIRPLVLCKKIILVADTALLITTAWITFMKTGIKTHVLY